MKKRFIRQDSHKKLRLGEKWRRPRGLHSKLRLQKSGHTKLVSVGYGRSGKEKGTEKTGLIPVLVCSLKDTEKIDAKKQCAVISKKLGLKKKIEILKETIKKQIIVSNIKDAEKFINEKQDTMKKKKQEKDKIKKEKEDKKKQKEKEAEKKKPTEEKAEKTEEEKKEEEKREKDKLLTRKTE